MFKPDELTLGNAITTLYQEIKNLGVSDIRVSPDVAELEVAAKQVGKVNSVGEHFRRSLNTLPPEQVLWIGLYDENNQCVTTCGSRLDSSPGWSLQHHIQQYFERTFKAEDGEFVRLSKSTATYASAFSGKSVYVGEGYVHKDWRAKNLLGLAQRLLIISGYLRWSPDLIYGFMRPDKIYKRYHLNWGYSTAKPQALIWEKPPAEENLHDLYFVALGTEGVLRLCQDPLLVGLTRHLGNNKTETLPLDESEMERSGADNEVAHLQHLRSAGQ